MHHNNQPIIEGLLPNGELDFAWLAQNSDVVLDSSVVKMLLKNKGGSSLQIHGKIIRFSKRYSGKPVRVNLGDLSYDGACYSAKRSIQLIKLGEEELKQEKSKNMKQKSKIVTFENACFRYRIEELHDLAASTIHGYKTLLNRVERVFGSIPIYKLSHADVDNWVKTVFQSMTLSPKTVKETLWMLRQILENEIDAQLISAHSINFAKLSKKVARRESEYFTSESCMSLSIEDIKLLNDLNHDDLRKEGLHSVRDAALLTATSLPGRSGEVRALAKQDINCIEDGKYEVQIERTCVLDEYKAPKTANNLNATIKVFKRSTKFLKRLMKDAEQYAEFETSITNHDKTTIVQPLKFLVINPKSGQPFTEPQYRRAFYKLQKLAGITEPVPPKQLRHTAAHLLGEAGIDVRDYRNQFTHTSHETTVRFYGGKFQADWTPETSQNIEKRHSNYFAFLNKNHTESAGYNCIKLSNRFDVIGRLNKRTREVAKPIRCWFSKRMRRHFAQRGLHQPMDQKI